VIGPKAGIDDGMRTALDQVDPLHLQG
jgi:hypothetical protein